MKIIDLMGDVVGKYAKESKVGNKQQIEKIKGTSAKEPESVKGSDDRVEISNDAKMLLQLADGDPEKAARIQKIRLQIGEGTYRPNVDATARAILKEWSGE